MTRHIKFFAAALTSSLLLSALAPAETLPPKDMRAGTPKTLNTLRSFPEIRSRAEWEKRAREIREHVLVSCGLWPMPERTPLGAKVFWKIERDGYTIE